MVGGEHHQGLPAVGLVQVRDGLEHPTQLLVGDLCRAPNVRLVRAPDRQVGIVAITGEVGGVGLRAPHVRGLVDRPEGHEHPRPGLFVHHLDRRVRDPDVAARVTRESGRVGPREEAVAVLGVDP